MLWAISQQTAAEIVARRADAKKDNMGLTTWAILEHFGKITRQLADELAGKQYDQFKSQQIMLEKGESLNQLEDDLKKIGRAKKGK